MAMASLLRNGVVICSQMSLRMKLCAPSEPHHLGMLATSFSEVQHQQCRTIRKHRIPKWKRQRREKFLKIALPAYQEMYKLIKNEVTPAEIRAFMRQKGIVPLGKGSPAICVTDSGQVFDEYVPKEQRGSLFDGSAQKKRALSSWSKFRGTRDVKKFEDDFAAQDHAEKMQEIYIQVHELLTTVFPRNFMSEYRDNDDYYKLHDIITEYAWPKITGGLEDKTLVWKYIETLEPAKLVHVAVREHHKEGNKYGQITVRFHSKQIMALYDRFGRLMHGSETVPKDTLDFIIFEKHLTDTLGKWRLHSKIATNLSSSNQSLIRRTMRSQKEEADEKSTAI